MKTFKALSVVSPAGDLICSGKKSLEIRKWKPVILPLLNLIIVQNNVYLTKEYPVDHNGRAIAMVDIYVIKDWKIEDFNSACGNYFENGLLAWEITNVRLINYCICVPAKLRIYDVEIPQCVL